MGRPCSSPDNMQLGILFANVVTVEVTRTPADTVAIARIGDHSIFDVFTKCFRKCTRNNSRSGLSVVELNKALDEQGFLRLRMRKAKKLRGISLGKDSFVVYGCRRWRNPDNAEDMDYIRAMWSHVNRRAKVACPLPELVRHLKEAAGSNVLEEFDLSKRRKKQHERFEEQESGLLRALSGFDNASQASTPMASPRELLSPSVAMMQHADNSHEEHRIHPDNVMDSDGSASSSSSIASSPPERENDELSSDPAWVLDDGWEAWEGARDDLERMMQGLTEGENSLESEIQAESAALVA